MTSPFAPRTSTPWDATTFRTDLQQVLDDFLDGQAEFLAPLGPDAVRLHAAAREAVRGGKRFRAAFCWWGYQAVQPTIEDPAALLRACAALEMLHASALVHDDLMDASDTRRGHPSAHKAFEAEHRAAGWSGDPVQFGASAAILLGDLMLGWADELLRTCGLGADQVSAATRIFDACRTEVIAGQFLDVSVQARGVADVATAMTVLRWKSAKYSIERPLHVGAALAGATGEQLAALTAFGLPVGEAFQLRDDLLGVFGDPEVTGKPAGDDLIEGKRTVLVALALEGATQAEAAELDRSLGTDLDETQVSRLREIFVTSQAQQRVEVIIDELSANASEALLGASFAPVATQVLRDLATAATQREV